jgi:hypothetical protein
MFMKKLLLLSLLCVPVVGMQKDIEKAKQEAYRISPLDGALYLGLAATHTTASLKAASMIATYGTPTVVIVGLALGSDYLLTKYAKDSK